MEETIQTRLLVPRRLGAVASVLAAVIVTLLGKYVHITLSDIASGTPMASGQPFGLTRVWRNSSISAFSIAVAAAGDSRLLLARCRPASATAEDAEVLRFANGPPC
jgi:hypothetical protein